MTTEREGSGKPPGLDQRPCRHCGKLIDGERGASCGCGSGKWFEGEPAAVGGRMTPAEKEALVKQWLGLAHKEAIRGAKHPLAAGKVEVADLYQEAVFGLMTAAERFDPARGAKFVTYATWWVRQHVRRAVEAAGVIHVPAHYRNHDREKWPHAEAAYRATFGVNGLDPEIDVAAPSDGVDERDEQRAHTARIKAALGKLSPRQAEVLRLRFGIGSPPATLDEIGAALGMSKERARQIQVTALRSLRGWLTGARACGWKQVTRRCRRPAVEGGYCELHYPQQALEALQAKMAKLFDRCEREDRGELWTRYERMERRERRLIRAAEALERSGAPRPCAGSGRAAPG